MEDALAREEYPGMLASLQPAQAASVLGDRLKRINKTNAEVADWLEERKKVEDLYVQGLTKLVRRQPPDSSSELGIFTGPWTKIVGSVETIAQSHHTFASRLESDVISSLREFSSRSREMASMSTIQGNLDAMVKELDNSQKAAEKLAKKGGKANSSKVDAASQKLDTARQEWDTQAPFIFEKLQAVDESRLNHMRDVLTQLLTHETDQVERCRITAESALGSMLEVNTAVEIKNFAANQTKGKPKVERAPMHRAASSTGSASIAAPTSPGGRPNADDQSSMHSRGNDGNEGNEKESKGGLRRLGTMLNRRRQSVVGGSGGFARAPSPSKGYAAFGRSTASRDGRPSPSPRASSNNLRSANADNRLSSLAETSPTLPETPSRARGETNGTSDNVLIADLIAKGSTPSALNGTSKPLPDLSDVEAPPGPPPSHINNSVAEPPKLDAEGFTIPAARNDPIAQAQAEAAETAEQQAFKLNIKPDTIREDDEASQAALSSVANTLRTSTIAGPSRKQGTIRGRRDVRNTMYIPPPDSPDMRIPDTTVPSSPSVPVSGGGGSRAAALAALSSGVPASDAGSIRSSKSTTASKHPELHGPGLNSSIHETVSAYFENGEIKSASVIGELALIHGYNEANPMASSGTDTIRLDNFAALEAIVPNQAFVNPLSADRPGEYTVELSHLAKTTIAFHYKVHIDDNTLAKQAPIIVKPAWRPQEDKLGVVIEYGLNPAFASAPITLQNFVLLASYTGGKAAGCQTKPTGTHLKEKALIYWRLGDVHLDGSMQKVIGRLVGAEGAQLQAGSIEARWEYQSSAGVKVGSGLGVSRLDASKKDAIDPFADDSIVSPSGGSWVEIQSARKVVSGKYEAKQITAA